MIELKYKPDLSRDCASMTPLKAPLIQGDKNAHTIVIAPVKDDKAFSFDAGATIVGNFVRLDDLDENDVEKTLLLTGSVSDGKAILTLPAACYAVVGRFRLLVTATVGEDTTTVLWLEGRVASGKTDAVYDPESAVPDITDVLAKINDCKNAAALATQAANDLQSKIDAKMFLTSEAKQTILALLESAAYVSDSAIENFAKIMYEWRESDANTPIISFMGANKTNAVRNEEITFVLIVQGATSIRVYIDGRVNRYIYDVTDGVIKYPITFVDSGARTVAFEPCKGDTVGAKTDEKSITITQ